MYIPPKRRRRILTAHHLRQQGMSLRKIAERLGVSHTTIRADLKLLETHWSEIAAPAADDLLLNQLHLLRCFLPALLEEDLTETYAHFSVEDYTRLYKIRATEIATFLRETRRTVEQVHRRAAERKAQPDLFDYMVEESTEDFPELSNTVHLEPPISQPDQEIVESGPSEKVETFHFEAPDSGELPEHILDNSPDDLMAEATAFIEALYAERAIAFAEAAGRQQPAEQVPD